MSLRAILFDVGGPLNTEVTHERLWDAQIRTALADVGIAVSDQQYAAANQAAIDAFAPNAYQAIIWRFTAPRDQLARQVYARAGAHVHERTVFEVRPGIADLLAQLVARGLRLGLAANQPAHVLERLDALGLGHFFQHREVSGIHGYSKPDARLFLRACADLGVAPAECLMVGDRVDNDIVPAKALGMRTVLFRTGRHRTQQPRSWEERPDFDVQDVPALQRAITAALTSPEASQYRPE